YLYLTDPKYIASDSQLDKALFEAGYRSTDPDNYYEKIDYGVTAGFSYYLDSGLYFNLRYYMGLQDIYKIDNDYQRFTISVATDDILKELYYMNDNFKFAPMTNTSVQISVGYKF